VALAVTAALSGCALTQSGRGPSGYSFAYQADNREEVSLVQVFDDGTQTYVQVSAAGDQGTRILDENGNGTTPVRTGAFLVVPGVHTSLTLERPEGISHISHQGAAHRAAQVPAMVSPPKVRSAAPATALPGESPDEPPSTGFDPPSANAGSARPSVQGETAALQAEVELLRAQVHKLETQIAQEQAALDQTRQMLAAQTRAETFLVHFANNSARAQLTAEELADIVSVGKQAQGLIIEGYTDGFYANDAGERLAQARARNVADILAGSGLKRDAMSLSCHPAGGFARENTSDLGRAFNRRVSISFRFTDTFSSG
jgi:outer membrane protein OmpA-like peptidoglycan-associated protein